MGHFLESLDMGFAVSQSMAVDELSKGLREFLLPRSEDLLLEMRGVQGVGVAEKDQVEVVLQGLEPRHGFFPQSDQKGVPRFKYFFCSRSWGTPGTKGLQERFLFDVSGFQVVDQCALLAVLEL